MVKVASVIFTQNPFLLHQEIIGGFYLAWCSKSKLQISFKFKYLKNYIYYTQAKHTRFTFLVNLLTPVLNLIAAISFNLEKTALSWYLDIFIFHFMSCPFFWPFKEVAWVSWTSIWEPARLLTLQTHIDNKKHKTFHFDYSLNLFYLGKVKQVSKFGRLLDLSHWL